MTLPLEEYRVLDLGQIYVGGYCGMLLSYLGADVVKIEPPGGDTLRSRSEIGETPEFQFLNASKRGVKLDLKSEQGKQVLKDVVGEADVLLENYSPDVMKNLGLGYETLNEINPELIYAHGTGYGDEGPSSADPAMDITIQARGGITHTTGFPDQKPVKCGQAIADLIAGVHLALGIVSALHQKERTGHGQYVEIAMLDCLYPMLASSIATWVNQTEVPPRTGNRHTAYEAAPYNVYETRDGYVAIACINDRHWNDLLEVMDRQDLKTVEKLSTKLKRGDHMEEVDGLVQEWVGNRDKSEIEKKLVKNDIPCAAVQSIDEVIRDEQLHYRDMINPIQNKQNWGRNKVPVPGLPIKFSQGDTDEITQSPSLGEHTEEILTEIAGYSLEDIEDLRKNGTI
jgi:crotonobetainyl-CoA:carnitine CoA-transferase CaiB-like acyl-CoA transferase